MTPIKFKRIRKFLCLIGLVGVSGFSGLSLSFAQENPDETYEKVRVLVDILEQVQNNYVEETKLNELVYGAAHGVARTLDPFSQFLEPEGLKEMKLETEGEFGGLGIRIGVGEDGWLTIISPLPGTPAFKMGILPKDRIVKINGESTRGITMEKAVTVLRGKVGTKVTITVERDIDDNGKSSTQTKDVELTREVIRIQTSYSRMIEGTDIAYIRITEFNAKTAQEVHEALNKFSQAGMKALILELRNNPGGLLPAAIETVKEFIGDQKLIVFTQGRRPESRVEYRASARAPFPEIPMVVLINRGSASGSEILAGAFQDHKRALIVGSRTFGKASVQSVINLPDGSGLKLTTAYYYTPSGRLIHKKEYTRHKAQPEFDPDEVEANPDSAKDKNSKEKEKPKETWGIEPDIEVKVDPETEAKVQASFDLVYFSDNRPARTFQDVFKKKDKDDKEKKDTQSKPVKDIALERAIDILKARKLFLDQPSSQ